MFKRSFLLTLLFTLNLSTLFAQTYQYVPQGTVPPTCNESSEGLITFDAIDQRFEKCESSVWIALYGSGGGSTTWGSITGTLSSQSDLDTALNDKEPVGIYSGTGFCTANQFVISLNDSLAPTCAQPIFSDISGTLPDAQLTSNYSGVGTCTNQVITALNDNSAPTCTTITAAHTSGTFTPSLHSTSHKSGGSDVIKLDEFAPPTDITTLNATTSLHGLLPKLGGGTVNFLRADGTWNPPPDVTTPFTTLTSTTLQSDAVILTYTAITGLSFTPLTNTNYLIDCFIRYTTTLATTGINFAWDVPAGVVSINMTGTTTTTALGTVEGFSQRADNVGTSSSNAVVTVENVAMLNTQFRNGSTSTLTILGFTPETANSVSVIAGSTCQYRVY